jgi:hypothetical protein
MLPHRTTYREWLITQRRMCSSGRPRVLSVPDAAARARQIQSVLRAPQLRLLPPVQANYAAIVSGHVALIGALNSQIQELGEVVAGHFGHHRTLTSTPASPVSASSSAPGSWPSSATTRTDSPTREHERTTPEPRRSPAPPAARGSSWPATPATAAPTRCTSGAFCAMRGSPGARHRPADPRAGPVRAARRAPGLRKGGDA